MKILKEARILVESKRGLDLYLSVEKFIKFHDFKKNPVKSVKGVINTTVLIEPDDPIELFPF